MSVTRSEIARKRWSLYLFDMHTCAVRIHEKGAEDSEGVWVSKHSGMITRPGIMAFQVIHYC